MYWKTVGKRFEVRQIAVVGMLSAISIVLGASGGIHTASYGQGDHHAHPCDNRGDSGRPLVGMAAGLIFGIQHHPEFDESVIAFICISESYRICTAEDVDWRHLVLFTEDTIYKNSVLKRVSAVIGTLTNTVGVLGLTYLL